MTFRFDSMCDYDERWWRDQARRVRCSTYGLKLAALYEARADVVAQGFGHIELVGLIPPSGPRLRMLERASRVEYWAALGGDLPERA